jgi:geranylgeranyl diphosphate synthase type II
MQSFKELSEKFLQHFSVNHFPGEPATLYKPGEDFLLEGGKRIRPAMCLMANELFCDIKPDAYYVATAIELFHNFTLIHDDIMDDALLRRGKPTVHAQYGSNTALLCGDVMLIRSYDNLNKINIKYLHKVLELFNKTASEVCEGQQLDMDFEKRENVLMDDYLHMISLKTSVLLAASLQLGAIIGGATEYNGNHLYKFGKNLGIAFQIQDDYLDAFGDSKKFGKDIGGDIKQNKKTFLLLYALEVASPEQKAALKNLMQSNPPDKVEKILQIFKDCNVAAWANELKEKYYRLALKHLEEVAVTSSRKKPLQELADFLIEREY